MRWIPILVLLAGCARGPEADLGSISEARSLAAEWALVNEQAAAGRITATYTRTMRKQLREQLASCASTLTVPNARYASEIQALLHEPDDAAPEDLRTHVAVLKHIEDDLESA